MQAVHHSGTTIITLYACIYFIIYIAAVVMELLVLGCPDLADPPNGEIDFNPDPTAPFEPGTEAYYSCDKGFVLSGEDTLVCGTDFAWTGNIPSCERKCSLYVWVTFS